MKTAYLIFCCGFGFDSLVGLWVALEGYEQNLPVLAMAMAVCALLAFICVFPPIEQKAEV